MRVASCWLDYLHLSFDFVGEQVMGKSFLCRKYKAPSCSRPISTLWILIRMSCGLLLLNGL